MMHSTGSDDVCPHVQLNTSSVGVQADPTFRIPESSLSEVLTQTGTGDRSPHVEEHGSSSRAHVPRREEEREGARSSLPGRTQRLLAVQGRRQCRLPRREASIELRVYTDDDGDKDQRRGWPEAATTRFQVGGPQRRARINLLPRDGWKRAAKRTQAETRSRDPHARGGGRRFLFPSQGGRSRTAGDSR